MEEDAFGKLVRAYRKQRGWKQEELAERWGVSSAYISLIERGKRKLEKQEQIHRLADILGIPEERLAAVGKGRPGIKPGPRTNPRDSDDVLLQALLEPAQNTVKLSWLIWHGDSMIVDMGASLRNLQQRLSEALALYRGQFHKPALRLLGYTHEMLGQLEIEKTATREAIFHFQEMYDIADELGDVDMIALAIIHQASMLRRRGWYEAAFRRFLALEKHIKELMRSMQNRSLNGYKGYFGKNGLLQHLHMEMSKDSYELLIKPRRSRRAWKPPLTRFPTTFIS